MANSAERCEAEDRAELAAMRRNEARKELFDAKLNWLTAAVGGVQGNHEHAVEKNTLR